MAVFKKDPKIRLFGKTKKLVLVKSSFFDGDRQIVEFSPWFNQFLRIFTPTHVSKRRKKNSWSSFVKKLVRTWRRKNSTVIFTPKVLKTRSSGFRKPPQKNFGEFFHKHSVWPLCRVFTTVFLQFWKVAVARAGAIFFFESSHVSSGNAPNITGLQGEQHFFFERLATLHTSREIFTFLLSGFLKFLCRFKILLLSLQKWDPRCHVTSGRATISFSKVLQMCIGLVKYSHFSHSRHIGSHSISFDIFWYHSISLGIIWYHSISFGIARYQSISLDIIRYHSISIDITRYRSISFDIITQYHSISLDIIQYHSISLDITWCRSISLGITRHHPISLDIIRYESISIDITRYHSISLDIVQRHSMSPRGDPKEFPNPNLYFQSLGLRVPQGKGNNEKTRWRTTTSS